MKQHSLNRSGAPPPKPRRIGGLLLKLALPGLHLFSGLAQAQGSATWLSPGEEARPEAKLGPEGNRHAAPAAVPALQGHAVRVAYLIPTNRTAQIDGVFRLQTTLLAYHWWYAEQLERNGFSRKSFRYETEADGRTPKIHVVPVHVSDAHLRGDLWQRSIDAATASGVPVWTPRQVWWLVPEAHILNADGTLHGGTALGAGFGSGDNPGVGLLGSDGLARMKPELLFNNQAYNGQILPDLGPYRLKQDVTFPSFEGTTWSSVASSIVGAGLHEASHAFGLPHDFRNDDNFHGNLMGNGLRGWRGALYPDRYPSDTVRLSYGEALALNVSRYFNPGAIFTDQTAPAIAFTTAASVATSNGLLRLPFRASDGGGLAGAWLIWKGDLVGEMSLSGTSVTNLFETPYFTAGAATEYKILVFDRQGNRAEMARTFSVQSSGNAAPQPKIKVTPTWPANGQSITFDASGSTDPQGTSGLKFEWDYEGDGVFDTPPSTSKTRIRSFSLPGIYQARCRVTDAGGASVVSAPIGFRVVAPESKLATLQLDLAAGELKIQWPLTPSGYRLQTAPNLQAWQIATQTPVIWGNSNLVSLPLGRGIEFFRLSR